jgi:hypothetical protein
MGSFLLVQAFSAGQKAVLAKHFVNLEFRDLEIPKHTAMLAFCGLASGSLKLASRISSVSCDPPDNEARKAAGN